MSEENGMSRRAMLVKLGIFLNGIVGAALAVPIVRFLLSPVTREKKFGYESWLSLGGLEQFPAGQTRLATYRNPVVNSWDGETGDIACWVRNVDDQTFQVFAINCAHLGCPVRWFPQSSLFMCPCHGGAYLFHAPGCNRHIACADLRAFCRRGVEQPPDSQSRYLSWLVYSGLARLGLEFHGRDCFDSHGASLPFWSLQVSQRAHVDRWCSSLTGDAWNGFYWSNHAIRSGRVLGIRYRGVYCKPRSPDRPLGCQPHAWRPDHRRRDAFAILRAARFCYPRIVDRLRRRAFAHGAETWN